uniref:Defensin-like protein n=1 Tax=Solanum lycopersicum TaxID=4081 RepID=A0A3Q7J023_SOLLC
MLSLERIMPKLLTCVLIVVALFFVGTMIPSVESKTCYQIHPEILCDHGKVEPKCLPFCKKKFGPRGGGQCIDQIGFEGPFCACDYPC